jgi:urease accessory protein
MKEQYGENQFGKVSEISLRAEYRDGRTILSDVYFTAPYKIMKPFEKTEGGIQVMPLCASAGIMRGDIQKFNYYVGEGCDLEILSQSFEKIHKMDGGCASREINIEVKRNAVLYYYPQPVIPFAESAFESEMKIHLENQTSRLFLMDVISCGRSACDERFAYRKFASKVNIYREGKLIYRDNTCYEPSKMNMESIGMYEGYSHMATIFLSSLDEQDAKELQNQTWEILQNEHDCETAVTRLAYGDLAIRIFGNRAQRLQEIASKIKCLF